jgi:cytochrome P450 family 6
MGIVVYFILAILAFAYFWVQKRFRFWSERGFLSPKSVFPYGSFKGAGKTRTWFETMDNIYKEFKGKAPVAGFFSFMDPNVLPIDPEVFKNILVRDFNSFHERGFYYNKEDDPLSAQ